MGLSVPAVPITEHLKLGRVGYARAKIGERGALPVAVEGSLLPRARPATAWSMAGPGQWLVQEHQRRPAPRPVRVARGGMRRGSFGVSRLALDGPGPGECRAGNLRPEGRLWVTCNRRTSAALDDLLLYDIGTEAPNIGNAVKQRTHLPPVGFID